MAKLTLLEMVQRVLSSTSGDEVNSYADTTESEQIAFIIRDAYYDLISSLEIPEHRKLVTLTASGDSAIPTRMEMPSGVTRIEEIKYNTITATGTDKTYEDMYYVEPHEFMSRVLTRKSSGSNIVTITVNGGEIFVENDKAPEYYTSFDDQYLYFDSYDSAVDSTLQSSKFIVWAIEEPTFTLSDTFTPDLDANLFPILLNEAKSIAYLEQLQQANPKAEQNVRIHKIRWQKNKHNIDSSKYNRYERNDYGRRNRKRL